MSGSAELRRRIEDLTARLDALESDTPSAKQPILVKTIDLGDYPTTAKAMYAVVLMDAACDEAEGATPSLTAAGDDEHFFALNTGSQVPAAGTEGIICDEIDGLWQFEFDGA